LPGAPQVPPMPVPNRPVNLTPERLPDLDAEILDDPRRPKLAGDRIGRP